MAEDASAGGWTFAVESQARAVKLIKVWTRSLLLLALVQAGIQGLLLHSYAGLLDPALMGCCAFAVRRFQSRAAAVVLAALTVLSVGVAFSEPSAEGRPGGGNIGLGLLVLWAAVRLVQATIALHDLPPDGLGSDNPDDPSREAHG